MSEKGDFGGRKRWNFLLFLGFAAVFALAATPATSEVEGIGQSQDRPGTEGKPTTVHVGVYVLDVTKVDDESQSFTADLHFSGRWHDPRLARPEGSDERRIPLDQVWHPDLDLLNQREVDLRLPEVVTVDEEGNVHYRQRFYGTLSSPLDLRDFPFDEQVLPIHIMSYVYDPQEITLVLDEARTGRFGDFSVAGWQVELGETRVYAELIRSLGQERARMTLELIGQRDVGFYLYTVILPLSLIVMMAWAVFWIDPDHLPSQVGLSTASVFTLIAFRLSLRLMLPPISYMTRADAFLLGATLLVFLALGEAVATGGMAKKGKETLAHTVDRWARWIYAVAFAVIVVVTLLL
jgi:hypothetical protein